MSIYFKIIPRLSRTWRSKIRNIGPDFGLRETEQPHNRSEMKYLYKYVIKQIKYFEILKLTTTSERIFSDMLLKIWKTKIYELLKMI